MNNCAVLKGPKLPEIPVRDGHHLEVDATINAFLPASADNAEAGDTNARSGHRRPEPSSGHSAPLGHHHPPVGPKADLPFGAYEPHQICTGEVIEHHVSVLGRPVLAELRRHVDAQIGEAP